MENDDIGIITPYTCQVKLIKEQLDKNNQVEVKTIDQSQGRDKNCIIISFVRARWSLDEEGREQDSTTDVNNDKTLNSILSEERRLNVSLTRAKCKLIIICCREKLETYSPFKRLFSILEDNQIFSITNYQ